MKFARNIQAKGDFLVRLKIVVEILAKRARHELKYFWDKQCLFVFRLSLSSILQHQILNATTTASNYAIDVSKMFKNAIRHDNFASIQIYCHDRHASNKTVLTHMNILPPNFSPEHFELNSATL